MSTVSTKFSKINVNLKSNNKVIGGLIQTSIKKPIEKLNDYKENVKNLNEKLNTQIISTIDELVNNKKDMQEKTNASSSNNANSELGIFEKDAAVTSKPSSNKTTPNIKHIDKQLANNLDENLGNGFSEKLEKVSEDLGCNPNDLLGIFYSECGLKPNQASSAGSAVGLIQFMPNTCNELGYTRQQVLNMSPVDQLDLVEKFYKKYNYYDVPLTAENMYAITFLPGRANKEVLTRSGENYYKWNSGLDLNKDGAITKTDLKNRIDKKYNEIYTDPRFK